MEDDDEFGDLYTDVLRPLISAAGPQLSALQSAAPSVSRPVDPKAEGDDGEDLCGAPNSIAGFKFSSSGGIQTLAFEPEEAAPEMVIAGSSDFHRSVNSGNELENKADDKEEDAVRIEKNWASESAEPTVARVVESGGDVKLEKVTVQDPHLVDESSIEIVVEEKDDKDDFLVEKGQNFQIFDMDAEPTIPGLSVTGVKDSGGYQGDAKFETRDGGSGDGDDWDSDSEDDLQIVLNDNHHGPVVMDRGGVVGTDEDGEDEDGDPLVIVADSNQNHQLMEEQDWGEDAAQGADGERKELGEAAKVNGGLVVPLKIGYNNHGYHPFHSQFKVSDVVH